MTEFSARLCYNSVSKMGTSENFIPKVLSSGHLSVAEHASIMLPWSLMGKLGARKIFEWNRYFDFPPGRVAGNLRCWIELMRMGGYYPFHEVLLSVFGDIYASESFVHPTELHEWSEEAGFRVPSAEGAGPHVYLLAVNYGTFGMSKRPTTVRDKEWARYTWMVENVSRSLTHQLVRHRGASFSQESQRYVDFEKSAATKQYGDFIYPPGLNFGQQDMTRYAYMQSVEHYKDLRKSGVKKEDARFVLPNGTTTRMIVSFSFNELSHFLTVRCAKDAQWEIRSLAKIMLQQAAMATPHEIFSNLKEGFEIADWG